LLFPLVDVVTAKWKFTRLERERDANSARVIGMEDVKAMCERNMPDVLVITPSVFCYRSCFHVEKSRKFEDMCPRKRLLIIICLTQFCASMWTKEESDEIQRIAKATVSGIKTMAIPQGLQAEKGPDAVVEFLKEKWPGLVES